MAILGLLILIIVGTSIWMGLDAQAIGYNQPTYDKYTGKRTDKADPPFAWFLGGLLLWIVVFPWYLSKRPGYKAQAAAIAVEKASK